MFLGREGKVDTWASLERRPRKVMVWKTRVNQVELDVGTGADKILQEGVSVVLWSHGA